MMPGASCCCWWAIKEATVFVLVVNDAFNFGA